MQTESGFLNREIEMFRSLFAMLPILFVCGCGTAMNYHFAEPTPYGGVRTDVKLISNLGTPPETIAEIRQWIGILGIVSIFDLPFSAVADTILLPVTVSQTIERRRATLDQK